MQRESIRAAPLNRDHVLFSSPINIKWKAGSCEDWDSKQTQFKMAATQPTEHKKHKISCSLVNFEDTELQRSVVVAEDNHQLLHQALHHAKLL